MAQLSMSLARKARALSLAAASMAAVTVPALAKDFTTEQCKVIRGTAGEVVRTVGKEKLSMEFRQSLVDYMGKNLTCDGPKEIVITSHQDSVTYGTIRAMLLAGSERISLEKAGLRGVVQEKKASIPAMQKRTDAGTAPNLN